MNENSRAQRFSPRRKNSPFSEMNKERVRRLIKAKKMTRVGLEKIKKGLAQKFVFPADILEKLKKEKIVWKNFRRFQASYRRIRIGYIGGARRRPVEFQKRLKYFVRMTRQNKKFGMVQ